jgi:hypothetical protein
MHIWCIKIVNVKSKFCKFISTRRQTSIVRRIWLNFMVLRLVFIQGSFSFHNFLPDFQLFDLSITEETSVVEMLIWCIKIVNVKSKFCKFISTRRQTSIVRRIWLNFMALRLVFIQGSFSFHNFLPDFQLFLPEYH